MKSIKYAVILCQFAVLLLISSTLYAQDAKIPGGDQKVAIGGEVRNGKLVFESEDGNFRWWFDSRIQFDGAMYFENKNAMSNGFHFRRATFAIKSVLYRDWEAEVDIDFAEQVDTKPQTELRDIWIKYNVPNVNLSFMVGHFKEPFGMERLNSSRLLTFLERSSISSALPMGRRVGISARYWSDWYQMTGAIMGHEPATRIDKGQRDETMSTNLRASIAPLNKFGHNFHFGLAGSYKIPDVTSELRANTIEISSRTESYVFNPKFLHTGDIPEVNYYTRYGTELMYINGPFYIQSEVMGTTIKRFKNLPTANLRGGYIMTAFVLTGENRYYYVDEGEVGPIEKPKRKWGALEVAARYTVTNLNDLKAGVKGGRANQYMFGINYYPNTNIKFQLNYSFVNLDEFATRKGNLKGDDDHSFVQFRFQASL
ncbi:MAG TPA: porin [Ignavibacteriaceae bacterium]|nr:porin [Ignavibacteriaceae bacterium]